VLSDIATRYRPKLASRLEGLIVEIDRERLPECADIRRRTLDLFCVFSSVSIVPGNRSELHRLWTTSRLGN
jgi:hypothetical protein